MAVLFRHAQVFSAEDRDFFEGDVLVSQGKIGAVTAHGQNPENDHRTCPSTEIINAEGCYLLPGLVDVHTHGRAGGDFTTADETTLCRMAESYLASGVTTVLPTLASAPLEELCAAIDRIEAFRLSGERAGCARFAGIHLEGRYLNPAKRGAHAPHLLASLNAEEACRLLSLCGGVKHISAALELEGGDEFIARMRAMGATVGLGHTNATYAEAQRALEQGVVSMTHLFNAMPPLHHRDGGAVCAGLLEPRVYGELICDGFHIAPEMVKLAYRLKGDHLTLITDSMEATGCADGDYTIAGMPVVVKDGKARTVDGAIAGSTLSLWDGVKNLCAFADAPLGEAVYAATMAPALQTGMAHEVGSIAVGKRADLLLVNGELAITRVMCGGSFA